MVYSGLLYYVSDDTLFSDLCLEWDLIFYKQQKQMIPEITTHWRKTPGKSKQKYVPTTYVNLRIIWGK